MSTQPNGRESAEGGPDPRFLLANERTYLAWSRTTLALLAAAAAVTAVDLPMSQRLQNLMSVVLAVTGLVIAVAGYRSWRRRDTALRRGAPLPEPRAIGLLVLGLLFVGVVLIIAVLG